MTNPKDSTPTTRLRNIGIAAHIDAGKTTLSERILVATGKERRAGRVDEGTATLDWLEEERERGITISSAATQVEWAVGGEGEGSSVLIQLIDTPGHVDFTIEVERCMRVLDGGILVLDAIEGVQAQTDTVWRQMERRGLPALAFVNKCERPGADFLGIAASVRARLGIRAVAVAYPIEVEEKLIGVVDLIERRLVQMDGTVERVARNWPEGVRDEVEVLRVELIEALAEDSEELLGPVLAGEEPAKDLVHAALREAVQAQRVLPLFAGSAIQGLGVGALLDGVGRYLPAPCDRPPVRGFDSEGAEAATVERAPRMEEPLCALAFKVEADERTGEDAIWVRVYSGVLRPGDSLQNPRTGRVQTAEQVLRIHADHHERVDRAGPGSIVAVRGPVDVGTGDTLCDPAHPIALEPMILPEPVISRVLEPEGEEDRERLREALARLTHEDLALRFREMESSGQFVLEGMGILHLEIQLSRIARRFGLEPRVGAPQVSYRQCLLGSGEGEGQAGEALVRVRVEEADEGPASIAWGPGVEAEPELETSLLAALADGPGSGYPLLGGRAVVLSWQGAGEDRDAAGQAALERAVGDCPRGWLEPMAKLEVTTPEEFRGGILADLGSRGADIDLVQSTVGHCLIQGTVPLALAFDYSTEVRSLSQGRAHFTLRPSGHRPVEAEVLAKRGLVL